MTPGIKRDVQRHHSSPSNLSTRTFARLSSRAIANLLMMLKAHFHTFVRTRLRGALLFALSILLGLTPAWAVPAFSSTDGFAWQVIGTWRIAGQSESVRTGDAIQPGALLQPDSTATRHSILVYLPDGQSIGYECFTAEDCARGFRVPSLYRVPEPFAADMVARIRSVLSGGEHKFSHGFDASLPLDLPRDEVLAVRGPDGQITVRGLAARLPDGPFTYDIQPLATSVKNQFDVSFDKKGPSVNLRVPATGLYVVTVHDPMHHPRIRLFLAVADSAQESEFKKSSSDAKQLMSHWNDDFGGWSIHDFQWAFLQSLFAGPPQDSAPARASIHQSHANNRSAADVAAEPAFSPKPGILPAEANISMSSETAGAIIHYTLDSSQPNSSSAVYREPIVIKRSGLIIKAFASVAGKKDSAVVTGEFRARD